MVCAVQSRPNQRIHSGIDADVPDLALAFRLSDASEQHARLSDDESSRFQPEFYGSRA